MMNKATKPRIIMPKRPLTTRLGTQMVDEQLLELVGQGLKVESGGLGVVVALELQDQIGHIIKLCNSVAQLAV